MRTGGLTLRFSVTGDESRQVTFETADPDLARRLFPTGGADDD